MGLLHCITKDFENVHRTVHSADCLSRSITTAVEYSCLDAKSDVILF